MTDKAKAMTKTTAINLRKVQNPRVARDTNGWNDLRIVTSMAFSKKYQSYIC